MAGALKDDFDLPDNDVRPTTREMEEDVRTNTKHSGTEVFGGGREFASGAVRDTTAGKLDYEGFMTPSVCTAFAEYMHRARNTSTGFRESDNWQKGIPIEEFMKSMMRHMMAVWTAHREGDLPKMDDLMALKFNVDGMAFEVLKQQD